MPKKAFNSIVPVMTNQIRVLCLCMGTFACLFVCTVGSVRVYYQVVKVFLHRVDPSIYVSGRAASPVCLLFCPCGLSCRPLPCLLFFLLFVAPYGCVWVGAVPRVPRG